MIVKVISIMKKTVAFVAIAIFIIAFSVILIACKYPKENLDLVKVNLRYTYVMQFEGFYHEKWSHSARFAGFYTAEQKGFYEQNEINAVLIPGSIDFSLLNLLRKGEVFGLPGLIRLLSLGTKAVH